MSTYEFYYDESEHSRKINYNTVSATNYYDNFVTMIVGWSSEKEEVLQRQASFEDKYADRKDRNGEIKSTMLHQKQFKYGFASLITFLLSARLNILCYSFSKGTEIVFSLMQTQ